ncbi:MAG: hypothetical protein QW279_04340 [Candidatus Jordarchaeaceae archaeon]
MQKTGQKQGFCESIAWVQHLDVLFGAIFVSSLSRWWPSTVADASHLPSMAVLKGGNRLPRFLAFALIRGIQTLSSQFYQHMGERA